MHVVRNAHDHRVDLPVHGVEELAIVAEPPGLGKLLEGRSSAFVIHVAEGDDVLFRDLLEVLGPLAATADDSDIQLLGRCGPGDDAQPIQAQACKPRSTKPREQFTTIPRRTH